MATISAPTPSAARPLWQAPLFVLGVGALVTVWFCRPLWPDTPHRRLDRDLSEARRLLASPNGDVEIAHQLALRAVGTAGEQFPDRLGEAEFLLGSALVHLAEHAASDLAADHWREARHHLLDAEQHGVPVADRARLQYRLGKVGFAMADDLSKVIERLEESAPHAENRAEAYGLLTQAYLRLPQPNLTKAIEANNKQRGVSDITEDERASAMLLGGELLLRQRKPDEARKAFDRIRPSAPPAVLTRARLLHARSFQEEEKWDEASALYQKALADTKAPLPDEARLRVYYDLGQCFARRGQLKDAGRAWRECLRRSTDGAEGAASALFLASALLQDPTAVQVIKPAPEEVLEMLGRAVAPVRRAPVGQPPLCSRKELLDTFQRAVQSFRQTQRFDLALRLAVPYGKVADPGQAVLLRGDVSAEWAKQLQASARQAAGDARQADEEKARRLFRDAGAAYAEAADLPGAAAPEKARCLRLSFEQYLACGEDAPLIETLERYLKAETAQAKLGEGWYRLAEAHRRGGNPKSAEQAFRKCLEQPGRFGYLARYELAKAMLEASDVDGAEGALTHNLKLMRYEPDAEAQEKTLFALGGLLYQRLNYREAVRRFEEALGRYHDNPEWVRARFQLADSYRMLAAQENQALLIGKHAPERRDWMVREYRRWLSKAATEFSELSKLLETPNGQAQLTAEQRSQVPFIAAKCWFNLGEYPKALEIYESLATRNPGRLEGLEAMGGSVSCHAALGDRNRVRQRLIEIDRVLPSYEPSIRDPWTKWVRDASRGLGGL